MLEVKQLIAEVATRHGIRIDTDDPAFCLVTLNQRMLEETARDVVKEIRTASGEFEKAAEKVQRRAGMALAQSYKEILASIRGEFDRESSLGRESGDWRYAVRWVTVGLLSSLLIFGCGVLVGAAFH